MEAGPTVQLIQTIINPAPEKVGLVLDIDVFWEDILTMGRAGLDNVIKERFVQLRDCKNGVFEGCITERTKELFQ